MSTVEERVAITAVPPRGDELRHNWPWFVLLGAALTAVGCIALWSPWVASLATAVVIGSLLLAAGAVEIVGSFWSRRWGGFFLHLLSGLLSLVVGALCLRAPVDALLALTLLVACLLVAGGTFKIVAALSYQFGAWGWVMVSGVIDLALGLLIWLEWPASAIWVLGLFLGISLVFRGFNWIGLGLAAREQPLTVPARP
jgi:uncharacterized membrane protein HdeD (DUF308 family)